MAEEKKVCCPYCDEEMREALLPYCTSCGVKTFLCPKCKKPVAREKKVCPHCGAKIKGEKA